MRKRSKRRRSYGKRRRRYNSGSLHKYVYLVTKHIPYEGDETMAVLGTRQQAESLKAGFQNKEYSSDIEYGVEMWRVGEIKRRR